MNGNIVLALLIPFLGTTIGSALMMMLDVVLG